jgi:hypothetical protein
MNRVLSKFDKASAADKESKFIHSHGIHVLARKRK